MSGYHSRNSSLGYNNIVGPGSADILRQIHNTYSSQPMNPRYIQLFDSEHPQHPHPTLMPHFFQSFFDQYASEFTFLTYDETLRKFWEQRLCPTLSNCIAAMAVRCVRANFGDNVVILTVGLLGMLASLNLLCGVYKRLPKHMLKMQRCVIFPHHAYILT